MIGQNKEYFIQHNNKKIHPYNSVRNPYTITNKQYIRKHGSHNLYQIRHQTIFQASSYRFIQDCSKAQRLTFIKSGIKPFFKPRHIDLYKIALRHKD
jgi:hypothetical protein